MRNTWLKMQIMKTLHLKANFTKNFRKFSKLKEKTQHFIKKTKKFKITCRK